jgi:hypothetical protein
MNPRERFACHACGVRGHWKGDQPSQCRPEDVRAHIARLTAMVGQYGPPPNIGQLALNAPQGMFSKIVRGHTVFIYLTTVTNIICCYPKLISEEISVSLFMLFVNMKNHVLVNKCFLSEY